MIKANELRVGNWIASQYKEKPFKVTGGLIAAMDDGMDEYSVEGIPLTHKILNDAGFNIVGDDNFKGIIYEIENTDEWQYNSTKLKHLHQLQNLYFSLTGEELTLDLCTNV
jgi:hypothetical protein